MYAAEKGKFEIVKLLIENGANPNAKNNHGWTVLMGASKKGKFEIVKLLVENDADSNAKMNDGSTALIHASEKGNFKIVVYILEHFSEIQPCMSWKMNFAVNKRIKEIIKIRRIIEVLLFPYDAPVIAHIISEFTDGLENLKKFLINTSQLIE